MAKPTTTLHYLDIGSVSLGEVIRLFLIDAGIDFNGVSYKYDSTWPASRKRLKDDGLSETGLLPVLEYKGAILTQHLPILRYLARDLGAYGGETNSEEYLLDAVTDIYIDWRTQWGTQLTNKTTKYMDETAPEYYRLVAGYYALHDGPYLLGDRVTYADFVIYQSLHNDIKTGTLPAELPGEIIKFRQAFEVRANIAKYLKNRT
ncbi:hypothetical protein NQ176_g684 [Zarea fungicola]|uniref:Uncharacterized protein n=1 Tax=Zarea fungicola TaxID=93591 RepID=A0ACC1NXB9_9HYPO|nr:hypothetical protein NQ176_g684 [Lecanicillium fungicola]